jgi:hypothetical protein
VARAIAVAAKAKYVHEPDNPGTPGALNAIILSGLFPFFEPGEQPAEYLALWNAAFGDAPVVVVKSVFACLSAEWIATTYRPQVVLVRRNPFNVIASWRTMGYQVGEDTSYGIRPAVLDKVMKPLGLPERPGSTTGEIAWWIGVLFAALEAARERAATPWIVVDHDELCLRPEARFRELLTAAGETFTEDVARYLTDNDRPGSLYAVQRVTRTQPENWRHVLSTRELKESIDALEAFPESWWHRHLESARAEDDARQQAATDRRERAPRRRGGWRLRLPAAVSVGIAVVALVLAAAGPVLRPPPSSPTQGANLVAVYRADLPDHVNPPQGVDPVDIASLDLKGDGVYQDGDYLVGRLDVSDPSDDGVGKALVAYKASPGGSADGDQALYEVQFQFKGKGYFLAFAEDAGGGRQAFGGAVSSGRYAVSKNLAVGYQFVGNSIFLRTSSKDIGTHDGDTLGQLSAHSFLGRLATNEADSISSFDATLRSSTWQPLVFGASCPTGCLVPSYSRATS